MQITALHAEAGQKQNLLPNLGIVEEEADESAYWLEMFVEAKVLKADSAAGLLAEADELTAIMATSRKTARQNG